MKLPDDFITKYQRLLGTEAPAFLAALIEPANTAGYRVNPERQVPAKLTSAPAVPYAPWGYFGTVKGRSLVHQSGTVYSQEPSAMFVGATAAPARGERVLGPLRGTGGENDAPGELPARHRPAGDQRDQP